jgi:hypothetical protein
MLHRGGCDWCFVVAERGPDGADIALLSAFATAFPRVDDPRVVSGIVYVIRDGWQWKGAPRVATGRTRRSITASSGGARFGVFDRIFAGSSGQGPKPERMTEPANLHSLDPVARCDGRLNLIGSEVETRWADPSDVADSGALLLRRRRI